MNHVDSHAITHVSLCSGYGGIDLGLKRVLGERFRTVAYCEIEAFACANLVSKAEAGLLDNAPIWSDLKRFPWGKFRGLVDILSGGYPCQPFSAAGKRLGTEDPRHLWPYIADGIAAMRPSVCFFENVKGHISLGLPDVIEDLGRLGYRTTWGIFSASEVGAPHQRKRVFIMAHRSGDGHNWRALQDRVCGRSVSQVEGCSNSTSELAHLVNTGSQGRLRGGENEERENLNGYFGRSGSSAYGGWPIRPGQPQYEWEPPRVVGNSESKQGSSRDNGGEPGSPCQQEQGEPRGRDCGALWTGNRQAEPALGGDPDGTSRGLGYAELCVSDHAAGECESESGCQLGNPNSNGRKQLHSESGCSHERERENRGECALEWASSYSELCVSCDNRTDELRLLGNGVVPATAALAFRTLWEELTNE